MDRWQGVVGAAANPQRPLWASTGVKNPDYPATLDASKLVTSGMVNTMPGFTLDAIAAAEPATGDSITPLLDDAQATVAELATRGINLAEVTDHLKSEGITKFADSWNQLTSTDAAH